MSIATLQEVSGIVPEIQWMSELMAFLRRSKNIFHLQLCLMFALFGIKSEEKCAS